MPTPRQREKISSFSRNDLILERLDDIKEDLRKIDARIDKLDNRIDKLENRMDRFENELRSVTRHSQIMTSSVVGIALAVIYFVFTR